MVKSKGKSVRRAARLVQLGAGLAGRYLAYQAQRPFVAPGKAKEKELALRKDQARRVREELQKLRGPIMKVGQALSMQTRLLGPEMIAELSALQMHAPPMHPSLLRAQFKASFGKRPEEVFATFEEEPFAAASLGQVHRAVTKAGEEVAVKIQYPAMQEAIAGDFQALRAAGFAARLSGHLADEVIQEAERGILEETDYENEAKNIEFFREALAPLPFVQVPKVYRELSSDRVLTMSRIRGARLQEFLQKDPPQALRDSLGAALTHLFFFQLFQVRALHADPHPGNYLFNRDGTIGLVDFGCVKYLKPAVVHCYRQFWLREWVEDERLTQEIVEIISGPKVSARQGRVRRCMREICRFYDRYHPLQDPAHMLDLGDPRFMSDLGRLARELIRGKFLSPDFLFLSRAESGMCANLLHILKARVPTTQIVLGHLPK